MNFENGVIVKIYKSYVNPILIWGRLGHPKTKKRKDTSTEGMNSSK